MPFTNPYLSHKLCVLFSENVIIKSGDAHFFKQMRWLPFDFVVYFVGIPDEAYCSGSRLLRERPLPNKSIVLVLVFMCFVGMPNKDNVLSTILIT